MFGLFIPVFKLPEELVVVSSIEAPLALLQKPVKMLRFNTIEPPQMPLGLVPEILNPVDVIG